MDYVSAEFIAKYSQQLFPGTPEQAEQFREWILGLDELLTYTKARDWIEDKINAVLSACEANQVIQEALYLIARDIQKKASPNATIRLPGYGYPLEWMPSSSKRFRVPVERFDVLEWKPPALLIRELCMLKVVEEVTNKPGWWENVRKSHIAKKWKKEILALEWEDYLKYADFTPSMAALCIEELEIKSNLYERTGLIPVLDYDACVIKADKLVPDALRCALITSASKLETLVRDRMLNSSHTLDLIDPSTCPLMYGRSRILSDRTVNLTNCLEACGDGDIIMRPRNPDAASNIDPDYHRYDTSFQWLPCEVLLEEAGTAKIDSSINNLHPIEHADMYPIIESMITLALPAWDLVYRWPRRFCCARLRYCDTEYLCTVPDICGDTECSPANIPASELRKFHDGEHMTSVHQNQDKSKDDDDQLLNLKLESNFSREILHRDEDWYRAMREDDPEEQFILKWFHDTHPLQLPEPKLRGGWNLPFWLEIRSSDFFPHKNERLQIIVKLTHVHLTPENPNYKGGPWETDGLHNEHIVSTALFCYDSDNVTDSYMYFGVSVDELDVMKVAGMHLEDPLSCWRTLGISPEFPRFQVIGRVPIHPATAVFYPNVYKHREGSFSLVDPSRPGYRKILRLFLVDPAIPIISTSNVPPQQSDWWTESKVHYQGLDLAARLPPELRSMVYSYVDFPFNHDEAQKTRKLLRKHRRHWGEWLSQDGKPDWYEAESEDEDTSEDEEASDESSDTASYGGISDSDEADGDE